MPSNTPNYNLTKPDVGGSVNQWGTLLNADLDQIDAIMKIIADVGASAASDAATALSTANAIAPVANTALSTANAALALASSVQVYPDHVKVISTTNTTTTLTAADQGVVIMNGSGNQVNLPATAADGTTFKFIGGQNYFDLLDASSNYKVDPGTILTVVATNQGGLKWNMVERRGGSLWSPNVPYLVGDIVFRTANYYICIQNGNQGQAPDASPSYWMRLLPNGLTAAAQVPAAIFNFDGAVGSPTPTGFNIASVNKTGTGVYDITLTNSVPSSATVVVSITDPGAPRAMSHNFTGGTTFTISTYDLSGTPTDARVHVIIYPT